MAAASAVGVRRLAALSATTRERKCTSMAGMSIATGHTSRHAPHKVEANGSVGLSATPVSCGVSTAPIGPG